MSRNLSTHPFDKNCVHRRTFEKNGQNFVKRQGISPLRQTGCVTIAAGAAIGIGCAEAERGNAEKGGDPV